MPRIRKNPLFKKEMIYGWAFLAALAIVALFFIHPLVAAPIFYATHLVWQEPPYTIKWRG